MTYLLQRRLLLCASLLLAFSATAATAQRKKPPATAITAQAIQQHYLTLGQAIYRDVKEAAENLQKAVDTFIQAPSAANFKAVREAYRLSRIPYQQSEAYRFANAEVDELEGRVNAWPVDEGLIDYVQSDSYHRDHPLAQAHVIATPKISFSGKTLDFKTFDAATLRSLHEIDGEEGHVATGYHAIEFLLWGQDLSGFEFGAGKRPYTDYDVKNCTGGHCARRAAYLKAASDLLVSDLSEMLQLFDAQKGELYKRVQSEDPLSTLKNIFSGLASLSYGELAGERMQLGLLLHDPEEEHECFSDLTHLAHYYNVMGMEAVYYGSYTLTSGQKIQGPSLAQWAQQKAPRSAAAMDQLFAKTRRSAQELYDAAEKGMSYDTMLNPQNKQGAAHITALVTALKQQSYGLANLARELKIPGHLTVLGSESLDSPQVVLKPDAASQNK